MSYLSQFHYQITGKESSEKKLVFLHGLMGSGANWRTIANSFVSDFHILYYDQRGHGRSISPTSGYGPENFAEDLKLILDELGWKKIYLVGHSMGGRAAAQFAFMYPDLVERLVIEDIGPDTNPSAIQRIEEILDRIPAPFANKKEGKEYFMNQFARDFSHRPQARLLGQFLYTNFVEKDGLFDWRFNKESMRECVLKGRERERFAEFAQIVAPTLLIRGENSEELSVEVYQRVLTECPRIIGVEIADAGHWVHFDQTAKFVQVVKDFFSEMPLK